MEPLRGISEESQESLLPFQDLEKDELFNPRQSAARRRLPFLFTRRFCTSGLSILHQALLLLLFLTTIYVSYQEGRNGASSKLVKSFVPDIGPASGPVIFTDSADWSGNTSQAAVGWNKWLKNFETHTIAVPEAAIIEFGYDAGLPDTVHSQRYGISMFHQIHCLATIREFAYLPGAMRMPDGKPLDHDGVSFSPFHMDHCFNYLRQAIECHADSTVEWAKVDKHGHRHGIQGWGIPHYTCRDRDALEKFALEHHEYRG